jgi:hypothetical protein
MYALHWLIALPGLLEAGPFLSGGQPLEHALSRYHVRWHAVTLVFLAFDMEMVSVCAFGWPAGGLRCARAPACRRGRHDLGGGAEPACTRARAG